MVRLGNLLKTRLTLSLRLAQTCHMVGTYLSHGWHQLVTWLAPTCHTIYTIDPGGRVHSEEVSLHQAPVWS